MGGGCECGCGCVGVGGCDAVAVVVANGLLTLKEVKLGQRQSFESGG